MQIINIIIRLLIAVMCVYSAYLLVPEVKELVNVWRTEE